MQKKVCMPNIECKSVCWANSVPRSNVALLSACLGKDASLLSIALVTVADLFECALANNINLDFRSTMVTIFADIFPLKQELSNITKVLHRSTFLANHLSRFYAPDLLNSSFS